VDLVVIGSGDPVHFKEFRSKTGYDGLLFSDPSLKAYSALGFSKGLMGFMSIGSVFKAASALKQGHRQGSIQGSTLQLGGAIVIDASGAVRYFFAGKKAGDHPDIDTLLMALDE
jgi:peroxiredoxin